ncbi:MAG: hypothetical protein WAW90_03195 [Minisyncoccia bacterium]
MKEGFIQRKESHKETPARFRLVVEAWVKANFSNIEVLGEENLKDLPPDAKVIFATTHISDLDVVVPIAKLGKQFRLRAVNASVQHSFKEDARTNIFLQIIGEDNTMPVDMKWGDHPETGKKEYYTKKFNPENFEPMKEALEDGDTIVMAAYTPVPIKDGKIPDQEGHGVVYLAEISDAVIVPIAINIKSEDPHMGINRTPTHSLKVRPAAEMIIGKPITLEKIEGVERFGDLIQNPGEGDARKEITEERKRIEEELRTQSNIVMQSLADLLPEERRGKWSIQNPTTE